MVGNSKGGTVLREGNVSSVLKTFEFKIVWEHPNGLGHGYMELQQRELDHK